MTIADFDDLPEEEKKKLLFNCCGSHEWVRSMLEILPVEDLVDMLEYAEEKWYECNGADWLEAFAHHARLGDVEALSNEEMPRFGNAEQRALLTSDEAILKELAEANEEYEETFGYLYISFAPERSAEVLLEEMKDRLNNDPRDELQIAAAEQDKITKHRIKKMFGVT